MRVFVRGRSVLKDILKYLTGMLPPHWQVALRRVHYRRQIRAGTFHLDGNEERVLEALIRPGDWVLDIGANVGQYTVVCSRLVGPGGRIVAVEPVPQAFALLVSNCDALPIKNVTLLNLAASDRNGVRGMSIPLREGGLPETACASITSDADQADTHVQTVTLDSLQWPTRIALVKIDTEGHEMNVLRGMTNLLTRDRPHLIVEASSDGIVPFLSDFGYRISPLSAPANLVFIHQQADVAEAGKPLLRLT